jgi:hypothetical protein
MDRGRDDEEEALLNIIASGEYDGSKFMNDFGEGMELDQETNGKQTIMTKKMLDP